MRLLARYLMREALVALGFCFSAFLILWVMLQLFSDLQHFQDNKTRMVDVAEFYILKIPEFLPIVLPVALLLALLYALTNHARHNEITAIRAAGVSLWRLSWPYFFIGIVAAAVLFAGNELVAPKTADITDQIWSGSGQRSSKDRERDYNRTFYNSREGRLWHIDIYNQRTAEMIGPVVDWKQPDGSIRKIAADRAVYTNNVWLFFEVRESRLPASTNALIIKLPPTNMMAFPEFHETPEMIKSEISVSENITSIERTRRADLPIREILNYLRLHPNPDKAIRAKLFTKLHGRLAGPCTCLVVVLLAVPFAGASGRRNVFVGVAASISIFFAYYLLQQIGFAFGEAGRIPAWFGAWFPNLLFGITGLYLMAKVR
jgi:lipopolysaccharide export system permease protein